MKQFKIFWLLMLFAFVSQADLLGRLRIEEVLKDRLEQALKIGDESAKITIRIEYDKYEAMGEDLPGTNHTAHSSYYAEKAEDTDIKKISVQYFSENEAITAEQSALIYSLIPTDKNKINIVFKNLPKASQKVIPVQPKDLQDIADKSIELLSLMLGGAIAVAFLIFGVALFFNNSKNRNLFKQQFGNLISSLSNGMPGFASSPSTAAPVQASVVPQRGPGEQPGFSDYSNLSIAALFSDLYWCEKDSVAHYLWNNISATQKATLLEELDFMHAYSIYFSSVTEKADDILFHPYYNKPLELNKTSQEALSVLIKKNYSLWMKISPLRQASLSLSLKERIKANSSPVSMVKLEAFPESKLRQLPRPVTFGEISFEDELEIYQDQNLIPENLRPYIGSLVWLALKDKIFVEQQFEKLDAKYLASAWIAAPEVLSQLEQCIPEKKLLLLKSYLNSNPPTKSSSAFQYLFKLGLEVSNENYEPAQKAS